MVIYRKNYTITQNKMKNVKIKCPFKKKKKKKRKKEYFVHASLY